MPQTTKIATCNFCGTRAALVLKGEGRHELTCQACGAPLHEMKAVHAPQPRAELPARRKRDGSDRPTDRRTLHGPPRRKKKKKKNRKGLARRFFEEAFDVIEDILD